MKYPIPYSAKFECRNAPDYENVSGYLMCWEIKGVGYGTALQIIHRNPSEQMQSIAKSALLKDFWRTRGAA